MNSPSLQQPVPHESEVLFSIVVATCNCVDKIDATLRSIFAQDGCEWECLVIDGRSTDGTVERLRSYGSRIRWLSEPDAGIYDAMNKGIRMAVGQFVYFIGAGDRLLPGVLAAVASEIRKLSIPEKLARPLLLYGNVNWSRYQRPYDGRFHRFKLLRRNLSHQAIFYQRTIFQHLGDYNTKYRLLADWDLNFRCFNDRQIAKHYFPLLVADYEGGGESNTTHDGAFHRDFRYLVGQRCGALTAWCMRIAFLLAHPRVLLGEPARQTRRLRRALAKF